MEIQNYDNVWSARISNAEKIYQEWEQKFKCVRLEDYYENFQWKNRTDSPQMNYAPYQLNLVHSTIKIKLANFLFQRPSFTVSPEPGHSHWNLDFAVKSAQVKQDTLNTIIKNRNTKFAKHIKRAALDSFFRFGVIEVGYAADWRNPQKDDPYLKSWDDPDVADTKNKVIDNNDIPINERFFVKRIKPWRFRVSVSDAEDLEDHEWVGYYQYHYVDALRKTPGIKWPENANGNYNSKDTIGAFYQDKDSNLLLPHRSAGICKVWNIWDLVSKKRCLLLADSEYTELWSAPFERLPLIDHRWEFRSSGFYPIPPTFYWLSSQDEINESREQIRSYRRRFSRKFQVLAGGMDEEEIEKFVSGPDGIVVKVKQLDALKAIDNPEIGPTSENALIQAKDDFNIVSGTSAEARGQNSDRETATQAKLVDARSQIRENDEQLEFSGFICNIGQEILAQAKEKLVEGLWVKMSVGANDQPLQDMQANAPVIQWIKAQDLDDGYDCTVDVDVQNATPAAMAQATTAYVNFVQFLSQNPMVAMSPLLIRETAYRFGYKNEAVIAQMQQVAIASMQAKAMQAEQQQSQASTPQQTLNAQTATPDLNTIGTQITNQLQ